MKKVLLINPPLQVNAQAHSKDNSNGLGLAYLHAVLRAPLYYGDMREMKLFVPRVKYGS